MIKKWNQFLLEFNKYDREFIKNIGDKLTFAIEYEICANEDPDDEPMVENFEKASKYVKDVTILTVKRKISYGTTFEMDIKEIENFIDEILNQVVDMYYDDEEEDVYDDILNPNNYGSYTEQFIIDTLSANVMKFFDSQNMDYLKNKVKSNLPKFWKKWNTTFKYELEGDNDKQRIIEFSPKTYISGIEKTKEQLNDFFDEFENQKYWYFNNRTALHFNIGLKDKSVSLNPLKGILLLSDFGRNDKIPYVFKGIEHRLSNVHVGSMMDKLMDLLKGVLNKKDFKGQRNWEELNKYSEMLSKNSDILDLNKLSELEIFLNNFLLKANVDFWVKEFGLNITQYKNNYVEFRFVGGDVKRDLVMDKLEYFSHITWSMSDPSYKRKEYIKKLYIFVEELKNSLKK